LEGKFSVRKGAAAFLKLPLVKIRPLFEGRFNFRKGPAAFLKLPLVKVRPLSYEFTYIELDGINFKYIAYLFGN